jgi:serine/alanine adding enzyme
VKPSTICQLTEGSELFDPWCFFVADHPNTSYYQSPAFFRFAGSWPEAKPVLLVCASDEGGEPKILGSLLAVMVHEPINHPVAKQLLAPLYRTLTRRTIVYGGPLLATAPPKLQQETLLQLLQALNDAVEKRSRFIQFRNSFDLSGFRKDFEHLGYHWQDRLNMLVDTSSEQQAWESMSRSRRRQVNSSLQRGATIVASPTQDQTDQLYTILRELYKNRVRKPLPSRAFFRALASANDDEARVLVVCKDNRVIGGIACTLLPGKAMHEWYVCGLDHIYRPQKIYPSVLATWAGISQAAKQHIPVFDFMGLGQPGIQYGVREFKARFGGQWENHGRYVRINNRWLYAIASAGLIVWNRVR